MFPGSSDPGVLLLRLKKQSLFAVRFKITRSASLAKRQTSS